MKRRNFMSLMAMAPLTGCFGLSSSKGAYKNKPKVIVVGAGLSGLVTALRLLENGAEVTLLDSEPRVGGRIYSVPIGGTHANLGAQYVFESDNEYMNRYVKKAERFSNEYPKLFDYNTGNLGILWDGEFVTARGEEVFLKLPIKHDVLVQWQQSIEKMASDRAKLMKGRDYIFDKAPKSELWRALDSISGADYLEDFDPDVENLFNMMLKPEGGVGAEKTSALLLAGWYGGNEKGATALIEGGNQKLAQAMADDIVSAGGEINLSTKVNELQNTATGVVVQCNSGISYSADYAVVTTPAPIARKLVQGLSASKAKALEAVHYGASMQVALHIKDFTKENKLASCLLHNENINAYMDQTKEHRENETVVCLNIAGDEVQKLDDKGVIQHVSDTLAKIYPDFDADKSIIEYRIKKWKNGIATFPPRFLSQHIEAIRAPSGRIFFAGDYTHSPELSGAAWSGVRAADAVLNHAG